MTRKLTRWLAPVVLGAVALSVGSLASASANHGFKKNTRLVFIEKSTAGTFVDVDKSGAAPTVGDVFVFQSDLLDPTTNAKVGTVEGHCTVVTESLSDCDASGILAGGQIRVAGASTDGDVNVLAVTGGTGIYRNVSGQITVETIDDNTSTDTLELTGVRR
jgi:allene oxide cyclase-like protein